MNRISMFMLGSLASISVLCRISVAQPIDPVERMPQELQNQIRGSEDFTLFSLDPSIMRDLLEVANSLRTNNSSAVTNSSTTPEQFHGYTVLGKAQITDQAERDRLVTSLAQGIENSGALMSCFNPRHGIKATRGTNTVELLISFDCGKAIIYPGGTAKTTFVTAPKPEAVFNSVLSSYGLPVSEKPPKRQYR